jgi:hypothetical protein
VGGGAAPSSGRKWNHWPAVLRKATTYKLSVRSRRVTTTVPSGVQIQVLEPQIRVIRHREPAGVLHHEPTKPQADSNELEERREALPMNRVVHIEHPSVRPDHPVRTQSIIQMGL